MSSPIFVLGFTIQVQQWKMTHNSGKVMFVKNFTKSEGAMGHYKHLTLIEREKLLFFMGQGLGISEIAQALGRSRSTI